jgi:hypothetical protein
MAALLTIVPLCGSVATAQTPPTLAPAPTVGLGVADPTAPLALTPAQRKVISDAVRQSKVKPPVNAPVPPVSLGTQLPASIALSMLPDTVLAQAPQVKTVQYTMINDQVVLVDPTNMRVVDIISQ